MIPEERNGRGEGERKVEIEGETKMVGGGGREMAEG